MENFVSFFKGLLLIAGLFVFKEQISYFTYSYFYLDSKHYSSWIYFVLGLILFYLLEFVFDLQIQKHQHNQNDIS